MSYESAIPDASVLIMPLTFFISPTDPRMLSTIAAILRPPEKGGLTANGHVHRYIAEDAADGIMGGEGTFTMCTFWMVEALTRAGKVHSFWSYFCHSCFPRTHYWIHSQTSTSANIEQEPCMLLRALWLLQITWASSPRRSLPPEL